MFQTIEDENIDTGIYLNHEEINFNQEIMRATTRRTIGTSQERTISLKRGISESLTDM